MSKERTNKCPHAKSKDGKSFFKVRQLEEPAIDKKDKKLMRQIRIRHSDLNHSDPDPFLRYWIKLYDLVGSVRARGLVAEIIKGPD